MFSSPGGDQTQLPQTASQVSERVTCLTKTHQFVVKSNAASNKRWGTQFHTDDKTFSKTF